ncbi:hypothetical protein [Paenibacillus sp. JCM 10914]
MGPDGINVIGHLAVFLASADADYMTGQKLMVDSGSIMLREERQGNPLSALCV